MALTAKVSNLDLSRRRKTLTISVQPSGDYASPETLDLSKLTNPDFLPGAFPGSVPDKVAAISAPAGYHAEITLGSTLGACTAKVFQGDTELTAANAYPAALLNGKFEFDISGPIGQF